MFDGELGVLQGRAPLVGRRGPANCGSRPATSRALVRRGPASCRSRQRRDGPDRQAAPAATSQPRWPRGRRSRGASRIERRRAGEQGRAAARPRQRAQEGRRQEPGGLIANLFWQTPGRLRYQGRAERDRSPIGRASWKPAAALMPPLPASPLTVHPSLRGRAGGRASVPLCWWGRWVSFIWRLVAIPFVPFSWGSRPFRWWASCRLWRHRRLPSLLRAPCLQDIADLPVPARLRGLRRAPEASCGGLSIIACITATPTSPPIAFASARRLLARQCRRLLSREHLDPDRAIVKDLTKFPELVWLDRLWMLPGLILVAI